MKSNKPQVLESFRILLNQNKLNVDKVRQKLTQNLMTNETKNLHRGDAEFANTSDKK